jgi:ubiquinone/menaquinone biosynthesis C-methylase UbiE
MDIGCGNGAKASELGKLLNLQKSQIICADIEQWFNYNNIQRKKRQIELLKIPNKGNINYPKDSVNLITMIHTIHHWCYKTAEEYIDRMRNLHDILTKNGFIVIIEHDMMTANDAILLDIEHGLWECVNKDNCPNFYKDFTSKYINPIELDLIMQKSGFKKVGYAYYDAGVVGKVMIPDKSYMAIYQKN